LKIIAVWNILFYFHSYINLHKTKEQCHQMWIFCHLEVEAAPIVPVVDDHAVIHHTQAQDLVRRVQRALDHVALPQHHIKHHHLRKQRVLGHVALLYTSITPSTTTYVNRG
jgi:hypothetical protein